LNLLVNTREYQFDAKKIAGKLRGIQRLEKKKLKNSCEILSKQADKYKEIIPLAQLIWDLHIGKSELISFKIAINEAVETYGLTPSAAALRVINTLGDNNEKGQLKKELEKLYLQKHMLDEACSRQSQSLVNLAKLKSYGITEDRILELNNLLENNGYKDTKLNSYGSTN
jgi:hypothetical protein